jgi:hypothetical protein
MSELEIRLTTGGTATVRGTPAEIAEVLKLAGLAPVSETAKRSSTGAKRRTGTRPVPVARATTGPQARVEALVAEGFFKTKRALGDVREHLGAAGHIYKPADLSPIMIRLVRDKKLRRSKDDSSRWSYTEW